MTKVVAVWDRDRRGHTPALPVSVYKVFFLCRAVGPNQDPSTLETTETGWFGLGSLPPLSLDRVTEEELSRVIAHYRDPSLPTEWD
ncbi:MAG: hypothetical protein ACRDZX_03555 [Acidimicrobiales bacterium]